MELDTGIFQKLNATTGLEPAVDLDLASDTTTKLNSILDTSATARGPRKLVQQCWTENPQDRPQIDQVIEHL